MSPAPAELETQITYLLPTSTINRRFWAPGAELNTGVYAPYDVTIRNARMSGPFTLDAHGFALGQHTTDITDWDAQYGHDSAYAAQVCDVVNRMCGSDFVIPMGGMIRSSGLTSATVQPPRRRSACRFHDEIGEQTRRNALSQGAARWRWL